ncbi:MAG: class I SAM-dependent methyltransferase [Bacteroidetes bacterium]|nr:class I SAM-dependent methyltransferase [Bacteroidota bacterium]
MNKTIYNTIGQGYNTTRRADPYISERILFNLKANKGNTYLDLGCGTGNYSKRFNELGYRFFGVDPSQIMLDEAIRNAKENFFKLGFAEDIPFEENYFDGAIAMFTFHHWKDQLKGLLELKRVIKPGGNLVMLSFTLEQMNGYWLSEYFPEMIKRSGEIVPEKEGMIQLLGQAGFLNVETENYSVHDGLEEKLLDSNKFHPAEYLKEEVRNGISSFRSFVDKEELNGGLAKLKRDIENGNINKVIETYNNEKGDYLFYIAKA